MVAIWCSLCVLSPRLRVRYGGSWRGAKRRASAFGNAAIALVSFTWSIFLLACGLEYESVCKHAVWFLLGANAWAFWQASTTTIGRETSEGSNDTLMKIELQKHVPSQGFAHLRPGEPKRCGTDTLEPQERMA